MSYNFPRQSLRPPLKEPTNQTPRISLAPERPFYALRNPAELIESLKKYGLIVTRQFLNKPNSRATLELCEAISKLITGKILADFSEISDDELGILGDIKPYRDSLILLRFSSHMSWIFKNIRYPNFGINDLLNPDAERCRSWLNATNLFLKFADIRKPQCDQLIFQERALSNELNELLVRSENLRNEIEDERNYLDEHSGEIARLEQENKQLHVIFKQKEMKDHELRKQCDEIKEEIKSIALEVEASKSQEAAILLECEKLQSLITKDPQALSRNIADLRYSVATISQKLENLESNALYNKKQSEALEAAAKDVDQIAFHLQAMKADKATARQVANKISDQRDKLDFLEAKIKDLQAELKNLKIQEARLMERERVFLENQLKSQKEQREKIGELNRQIAQEKVAQDSRMATLENLKLEEDELEQEASKLVSQTDSVIRSINSKMEELKASSGNYIAALNSSLDSLGLEFDDPLVNP